MLVAWEPDTCGDDERLKGNYDLFDPSGSCPDSQSELTSLCVAAGINNGAWAFEGLCGGWVSQDSVSAHRCHWGAEDICC